MPYELLDEPEAEQEGLGGYLARRTGATVARGAESLLGLPGNIVSGGVNLLSAATGGRTPTSEQLAQKDIAKGVPSWLAKAPTSEQFRKVTKAATGEHLEPQTPGEAGWDEIVGDAATLMLGGPGGLAKKAATALGISSAGNFTKWGLESATGSPLIGGIGKLGATLLAGTLGTRNELNNLRKTSYEDAFKKIPQNKRFKFNPETSKINAELRRIKKDSFPDKEFVIDRLNEYKNLTTKGRPPKVSEVVRIKQGWNDHLRDRAKDLGDTAKRELHKAVDTLNGGIHRYGGTNQAFWKPYSVGEELTYGLRNQESIGNFINKHPHLKKKMDNPILGSLFKYGLGHSTGGIISQYPLQTGGAVGTLLAVQQASKAIKLISKSNIAANAYKHAVRDGLAGNVANFSRDLSKIESEYAKHEDDLEGQYELLD